MGLHVLQDDNEEVFHTDSIYARGLGMLNSAYHLTDIHPGSGYDALSYRMEWLKRRDQHGG